MFISLTLGYNDGASCYVRCRFIYLRRIQHSAAKVLFMERVKCYSIEIGIEQVGGVRFATLLDGRVCANHILALKEKQSI